MRHTQPDAYEAPSASADRALRISLQLRDALEIWYLTRTLEMGAHMAGLSLRFGARPEDADLVVVAPAETGAASLLPAALLRPEAALVAYSRVEIPGVRWLPRPARTRDARLLLTALARRPADAADGAAETRADSEAPLPFQVTRCESLLGALKRAFALATPLRIRSPLGLGFVALPAQDRLCAQWELGVGDACDSLRDVEAPAIRPLAAVEAAKLAVETHRYALPLTAVTWELAQQAMPVAATREVAAGACLRLRRPERLAVLTLTPAQQDWRALLVGQGLPLAELVARAPGGLDMLARFLNGCSVLGCLRVDAAAPVRTPPRATTCVNAGN